jgi:hypothetical protein
LSSGRAAPLLYDEIEIRTGFMSTHSDYYYYYFIAQRWRARAQASSG